MPMIVPQSRLVLLTLTLMVGCSGSDKSNSDSSSGGASGMAGAMAAGGLANAGGALGQGGSSTFGGTLTAGGSTSFGGASTTGGSGITSGGTATGGAMGPGGSVGRGGRSSSGGAVATGGSMASGGSQSQGGAVGTGGSPSNGGTQASGGVAGSGPPAMCDNLIFAAGSSGVAQPSGNAGNLKVLDWAGFKGAVTYTFDDANQTQIDAYSTLNGLGVPMTFYLITNKNTMSNSVWQQAVQDGHELGNHTNDHNNITASNVDTATTYIEDHFGVHPYTFAAPNGSNGDSGYEQFAKTRFLIDRGVANSLIMPNSNTDQWNLPCYIPPTNASASDFNSQIDSAESGGGWRVVLVHGFTGGSDGAYQPVALSEFTSGVEHAKSLGDLWIDSMVHVGSYWVGQKVFSSASMSAADTSTTWTWDWPDIYPPNSCLRVTVDGGTLSQNGNAIAWDDHGYYQISLDAGSLTLTE